MKAKNTPNLWRETATKPKVADWSYDRTKVKRKSHSKRKPTVSASKPKVKPRAKPYKTIVSSISLESLGLSFNATVQRKATITG